MDKESFASPQLQMLLREMHDCGGTDADYLRHHYARFAITKHEFERGRPIARRGGTVLDIGAHWLHQSALYALAGYRVTAMDRPPALDHPGIGEFARRHAIGLIRCSDLEQPAAALRTLGDDSIDLVLFTEILEHITFNPVAMWREVYRVLRPGGRIVISTPNYYAWRGRLWDSGRLFSRFGGGLTTLEILHTPTCGHHWKEYSLREVIHYFCLLSPDFNTVKALYQHEYAAGYLARPATALSRWLERNVAILRPNLHLEIELTGKHTGIQIQPAW